MTVVLALGSALLFGVGDFFGGRATRLSSAIPVTAVAYVVSGLVLIPLLIVVPADRITTADLLWGAVGGLAGMFGVLALYAGLGRGQMGVVAPLTAALTAIVPITFGFIIGERPGGLATVGIFVAFVAIVVISGAEGPQGRIHRSLLVLGLGAGLGFGLFFIALDRTSIDAGMWPLAGARAATIPVIVALAWRMGPPSLRGSALGLALGAGVLDMAANGLFLAAAQRGLIAVAAVLSSLYPAVTAVLARFALAERMGRSQLAGVALAFVAIVLIGYPT